MIPMEEGLIVFSLLRLFLPLWLLIVDRGAVYWNSSFISKKRLLRVNKNHHYIIMVVS
jgi:hypothetical protein